jgi:hypothetical protein
MGVLEFNRKRGVTLLSVIAIALAVVGYLLLRPTAGEDVAEFPVPGVDVVGVVEVLNGTSVDGLARSVTRTLRIGGIDVVFFGTLRPEIDTTRILVRRGDSTIALAVQGLLRRGALEVVPDAGLLVDVSVLLGTDFVASDSAVTQ